MSLTIIRVWEGGGGGSIFSSPEPKAHKVSLQLIPISPSVVHNFKDLLSQILCGASMGMGNEKLFAGS